MGLAFLKNKNKNLDFKILFQVNQKSNYLMWLIRGVVGCISIRLYLKSYTFRLLLKKINNINFSNLNYYEFLIKPSVFKYFKSKFLMLIVGSLFGYIAKLKIVGYHFRLQTFKKNKIIVLYLGFNYRIVLQLPPYTYLIRYKRFFFLIGCEYVVFNFIINYLRFIRNNLPYKLKGFLINGEHIKLKKGKKTKYR